MNTVNPDSEKGSSNFSSGSAVIPSYQPSSYRFISLINDVQREEKGNYVIATEEMSQKLITQLEKDQAREDEIYKLQKTYGIIIFVISVLLVLAGVGFSILQLLYTMIMNDLSSLETSLELKSAGDLAIKTSTIGAFILTISLVFFFLFLKFVYKPDSK